MTPTITIPDVDILEILDFNPALKCDGTIIGYPGKHFCGAPPAVWIMYIKPVMPCGCTPRYPTCLSCATCWQHVCDQLDKIACTVCWQEVGRASNWISRIETVKK